MIATNTMVEHRVDNQQLRQLADRLYNPKAAAELRMKLAAQPSTFDRDYFLAFITDHPLFSKMHLYSADDE